MRYVVLRHEGVPEPHFDLMFEDEPGAEKLLTWRSAQWPIEIDTPLVKLGDHRRDYLDYEGPVSGNRGFVTRVASGWCLVGHGEECHLIVFENETAGWVFRRVSDDRWRIAERVELHPDVLDSA